MLAAIFMVTAYSCGWILALIVRILLECSKPKTEKLNINVSDRYLLYSLKDQKIIGSSNDYQKAFKLKTQLGSGVMIKDTQFVKKRRM